MRLAIVEARRHWSMAVDRYHHDVFLKLGLWQVALLLLPSLVLLAFGQSGTIVGAARALIPVTDLDSWYPIHAAMDYAARHRDTVGLYQETYFKASKQFIYAPQSLALFIWLKRIFQLDLGDIRQAGAFSWVALFGLVGFAYHLFRLIERDEPESSDGPAPMPIVAAVSVLSVFAFWPVTWGYRVGNIQNILTFFMLVALVSYLHGRSGLAGLVLGLVVVAKPNLAVIAVWALLRRDWRFVAGLAATGLAATGLSIAMFGWPAHAEYLELLHYLSGRGESYFASHSFESTLYRALHVGNNLNWDGTHLQLRPIGWVHTSAAILGFGVMLAVFWPRGVRSLSGRCLDFGAAMLAVVVASPVAYEHHYGIAFMVIPCALLIAWRDGAARSTLAALAAAYVLTGGYFKFVDVATADTAFNVLQSYRLYGALLLFWSLWRLQREGRLDRTARGRQDRSTLLREHAPAVRSCAT